MSRSRPAALGVLVLGILVVGGVIRLLEEHERACVLAPALLAFVSIVILVSIGIVRQRQRKGREAIAAYAS